MANKNKELARLVITAHETPSGVKIHIEYGGDVYRLVRSAMERNEELAEYIMLATHDYLKEKQESNELSDLDDDDENYDN